MLSFGGVLLWFFGECFIMFVLVLYELLEGVNLLFVLFEDVKFSDIWVIILVNGFKIVL